MPPCSFWKKFCFIKAKEFIQIKNIPLPKENYQIKSIPEKKAQTVKCRTRSVGTRKQQVLTATKKNADVAAERKTFVSLI